ncbi:MAG: hypothetical protein ABEK10_02625 [Candidatus Nanosalina sp.]
MSTRAKYTLADVLEDDEIMQDFEGEGDVRDLPDAELRLMGEDNVVVTAPGISLADSLDRFKGPMSPDLRSYLNGFYGEFRETPGEAVVVVDQELKQFLGDEAVARFPEDDAGYVVDVKAPEEVEETVEKYDSHYTGDLSGDFHDSVRQHRFAVPALYDESGVIPETAMALMNAEGVAVSDRNPDAEELLETDLEGEYDPNSMDMNTLPAPGSEDVEKYVDVLLPPGYEEVRYATSEGRLFVQADDTFDSTDIGDLEVVNERKKNGVYTLELG